MFAKQSIVSEHTLKEQHLGLLEQASENINSHISSQSQEKNEESSGE